MSSNEQVLFEKFKPLPPHQGAAFAPLLAIAPALEAAGVAPMSEEEIAAAEIKAARVEPHAQPNKDQGLGCGSFLTLTS